MQVFCFIARDLNWTYELENSSYGNGSPQLLWLSAKRAGENSLGGLLLIRAKPASTIILL